MRAGAAKHFAARQTEQCIVGRAGSCGGQARAASSTLHLPPSMSCPILWSCAIHIRSYPILWSFLSGFAVGARTARETIHDFRQHAPHPHLRRLEYVQSCATADVSCRVEGRLRHRSIRGTVLHARRLPCGAAASIRPLAHSFPSFDFSLRRPRAGHGPRSQQIGKLRSSRWV